LLILCLGLQCNTALFSWKLVFECEGNLFEVLLSACSATEQQQWLSGIDRGRHLRALDGPTEPAPEPELVTATSLQLKDLASLPTSSGVTAKRLSIPRTGAGGTRFATCQVIIRNTHNAPDGSDMRETTVPLIHRSQSLLTTHRTPVLAPKRSERTCLEHELADVWTRDTLQYPGMTLARGGNSIRASAGSLVRKLSLASMHTPFTKRSTSFTLVGSHISRDISLETKAEVPQPSPEKLYDRDKGKSDRVGEELPAKHSKTIQPTRLTPPAPKPPSRPLSPSSIRPADCARQLSINKCVRWLAKVGADPAANASSSSVDALDSRFGRSRKRWSERVDGMKHRSMNGIRNLLSSLRQEGK
jgi:hypothetical protein